MKLSGHTILITGGASGIGLALAKRFIAGGSSVIACGRRLEQLERAKSECPGLLTLKCDLSQESERRKLVERAIADFPKLDVLVNNAGIQNRPPPLREPQEWKGYGQEIETNLGAPIHLSMLLIPHLMKQTSPAIVNVTSGLAFSPLAFMPTYCATKAAMHSFTLSLRHQLRDTPIRVVEVIPPAVNTDLGGKGLHHHGVPLDAFADHAIALISKGELEFGYGSSEKSRLASRKELDELFANMHRT